jgi:hypothetical protein
LTQAQQQQRELEKRIARAQENQRMNPYLLEVWRGEIARWKNVEQAAAQALRDLG